MSDLWVIPDEGKLRLLAGNFTGSTPQEDMVLAQFIAGGPVDDDSVLADFTQPTYVGYSPVGLSIDNWLTPVIVAHVGEVEYAPDPVFSCTSGSPQTVYGILLYGDTSGKIYAGCNYATPVVMSVGTTDTISPLKIRDKTFA